jgi:hypothetical protein
MEKVNLELRWKMKVRLMKLLTDTGKCEKIMGEGVKIQMRSIFKRRNYSVCKNC